MTSNGKVDWSKLQCEKKLGHRGPHFVTYKTMEIRWVPKGKKLGSTPIRDRG